MEIALAVGKRQRLTKRVFFTLIPCGDVAQLVRAFALHVKGPGFDPRHLHFFIFSAL